MQHRFVIDSPPVGFHSNVVGVIESDEPAHVLYERAQLSTACLDLSQRLQGTVESSSDADDRECETIRADLNQIVIDLRREFGIIRARMQ